jgi:hypothetical protein
VFSQRWLRPRVAAAEANGSCVRCGAGGCRLGG